MPVDSKSPPTILAGQPFHFIALSCLVALTWLTWRWMDCPLAVYFWIAISFPILHQVFVWLAWRLELNNRFISRTIGFNSYLFIFFVLFIGRFLFLYGLGRLDSGTLGMSPMARYALTVAIALPGFYAMYSVHRYFGFKRAAGADHFFDSYRSEPLVKKGIFRFTRNGMYVFAFFLFWAISIGLDSPTALVVTVFSHAYIWVHFFSVEKLDMEYIYSDCPQIEHYPSLTRSSRVSIFFTLFFLCSCNLFLSGTSTPELVKEKDIYETIEKDATYRSLVTTGSFAELAHGPTYYEYEGERNAEIIVFIHGFSVPSYIWDPLYDAAIKKGYRVLRMDLYGRGHSANPDVRYSADLFATQIFELLTYLDIQDPINLVGLSMGGRVISQFAAVYPDLIKQLIYIGPSGFDVFNGTGYDDFDVTEEEVQAFIDADFSTRAESQLADFVRPGRFASWVGRFRPLLQAKGFGKALLSTIKNERSMEQENRMIGRFQFPVTFFWGELDSGIPLKNSKHQIEEWIPRARLWVIPDSGHIPYMEQEKLFEYLFFEEAISSF